MDAIRQVSLRSQQKDIPESRDPIKILYEVLQDEVIDEPSEKKVGALAQFTGEEQEICELLYILILWEHRERIEEAFWQEQEDDSLHGKEPNPRFEVNFPNWGHN